MANLTTTAELYPPAAPPEVGAALDAVLTGDRLPDGRAELRRALAPAERSALQARRDVLARWTLQPLRKDVTARVNRMMVGFGSKAATKQEALAIAWQYSEALVGVPMWAVERACVRFETGSVSADEVGKLDLAWGPSTAQLAKVARGIAQAALRERARVDAALKGVPRSPPLTREQRDAAAAKVDAALDDFRKATAMTQLEESEQDAKRRERAAAAMRRSTEDRLAEYRAAGLEPPAPSREGIVTSLAMMLKVGWRVEELPDGRKVLTAPRARPPAAKAEEYRL